MSLDAHTVAAWNNDAAPPLALSNYELLVPTVAPKEAAPRQAQEGLPQFRKPLRCAIKTTGDK